MDALQAVKGHPKRQSSVRAPSQRRLIPQDFYGSNEASETKMTVNASKNLFEDQSCRKFGSQLHFDDRQSEFVATKPQHTQIHTRSSNLMGGLSHVRQINERVAKEVKSRGQKNSVFFSQSMKQKPRTTNHFKLHEPMKIAPQNINFNYDHNATSSSAQHLKQLQQNATASNNSLKIIVKRQDQPVHVKSIISPTAVEDEGEVDMSAIEMPAS